jgi:hypothetical protein
LVYNRKATAPWSAQRDAGIESATVDSSIEVPQYLQPVVDTGIIDKAGNWKGVRSSDETFFIDTTHPAIANGAQVLSPQKQPDFIDMTGYNDLFIALNISNAGAFKIVSIMGPDSNTFANLTPVAAGSVLRGAINDVDTSAPFLPLLLDTTETLLADVWNIFYIKNRLANQKLLQFELTNNSGDISDITFAYLRIV